MLGYKRKAPQATSARKRLKFYRKRKATYRRKFARGRAGFAKRVKDVILKTAETKYLSRRLKDTNMTEYPLPARYELRHNSIEYFHIFNNSSPDAVKHPIPTQGDGDGNRNGDEIYATGVRITGSITAAPAAKTTTYRMYLVEYNDAVYSSGSGLSTFNETFHDVSSSTALDTFQHDRIKPKYLRTIRFGRTDISDTDNVNVNFKLWLPLKRKLTFRQDDTPAIARGMKNKFSLMILPYRTIDTTQSSGVGTINCHATLYFKDP